jgi:hypothetical protein
MLGRPGGSPTGFISPRTMALRTCKVSASCCAASSSTAPAVMPCQMARERSSRRVRVRAAPIASASCSANMFRPRSGAASGQSRSASDKPFLFGKLTFSVDRLGLSWELPRCQAAKAPLSVSAASKFPAWGPFGV